jgi:hypothetical protein
MMEMSRRCLLRISSMSSMSKCQESEPQAGTFLFIEPQETKSHWELAGWPDAPSVRLPSAIHVSSFKSRSLISNGHLIVSATVNRWPDTQLKVTRLTNMWCPVESNKGPEPLNIDRTRQVRGDLTRLSVRSLSLSLARASATDLTHEPWLTTLGRVALSSVQSRASAAPSLLSMTERDPMSGPASHRVPHALGQTSHHGLKMTGLTWPASGRHAAPPFLFLSPKRLHLFQLANHKV